MQARAQFDPGAEQGGEPRHDRQAEAETLAPVALRIADLEEFVEHPRLVDRRDADAAVAHLDADAGAVPACRQQHAATARAGLDRVVEQPRQQAGEHAGIGVCGQGAGTRMQGHAGASGDVRLRRQHLGEQLLQRAWRGLRLQRAGIELRHQQQAVEDVGEGVHVGLQLRKLARLGGQGMPPQSFQRQVHRLQRLAQVVADRGEEAILGADRAIGLVHQPDQVGGQLPALRVVFVARALQLGHALRHRGEQGRQRMRGIGRWRCAGCKHARQPSHLACLRAALQDRGHGRTQQPAADGDARCQRELLHRIHPTPLFCRFRVGRAERCGDIPSALVGPAAGRTTRRPE